VKSLLLLLVVPLGLLGSPIPGFYNTGVENDGTPAEVVDTHWKLVWQDGTLHGTKITNDAGWYAGSSNARWIGPAEPGETEYRPGIFKYQLQVDLAGFDPATAQISGAFAADDMVTDITLNGNSLGIRNSGFGYSSTMSFLITNLSAGINTIQFQTENLSVGPGGLLVDAQATACADLNAKPHIDGQPKGRTVHKGESADFLVEVGCGPNPVQIQWRRNRTPIPGATDAFFSILQAKPSDGGDYDAVLTNSKGETISQVANLVVIDPTPSMKIEVMSEVAISVFGVVGEPYRVEATDDFLGVSGWSVIWSGPLEESPTVVHEAIKPEVRNRYYRVVWR
jgi:hypothetical protein